MQLSDILVWGTVIYAALCGLIRIIPKRNAG